MRRRRRTGNGPKGKTKKAGGQKKAVDRESTSRKILEISKESGMSVTAVDVVDTTTHHRFGHGHHLLINNSGTDRGTTEMEVVSTTPNNKAVGARKRKPTQISKIFVDKPEPPKEEDTYMFNHNNNNSPPYKKALIQTTIVEKNGMIQNIVTELKSAKKLSSRLTSFGVGGVATGTVESGSDDDNVEASRRRKRIKKGVPKEGKVDLGNVQTLLSSSRRSSESDADEDGMDMRIKGKGDELRLPYRCGVCDFGTTDRGVFVGHMKSHNGERSFQCRLCCFAFTTKANCERHLRNRHGEIDKDRLRNLVMMFSSSSSNNSDSESETFQPQTSPIPLNQPGLSLSIDRGLNLSVDKVPTLGGVALVSTTTTDDEQPLDLSMDAVDLSTKSSRKGDIGNGRSSLLRPRPIYPTADIPNLLTSPFVAKREPILHPQLSLQMLQEYNGLFNGCSPFSNVRANDDLNSASTGPPTTTIVPFTLFPFSTTPSYNPFSFPAPTLDKVGLNNSVNSTVTTKGQSAFMAPSPPASFESVTGSLDKEMKLQKPMKKESKKLSGAESSSASSASPTTTSRKRVDPKTGEYQKPKQRRYRTERPFSCPHCPARFTLRSNMERHGKHQHPNVWQRSPSNRVINRQQKGQHQSPLIGSPTMVHPIKHANNGVELKSKSGPSSVNGDLSSIDVRAVIAQQLKRKLSNSVLLNGTVGVESETDSDNNCTEGGGGRSADSSDLASVSQLLDRVKNSNIAQYFHAGNPKSGSTSDNDHDQDDDDCSGTESPSGTSGDEGEMDEVPEDGIKNEKIIDGVTKKKSAYSSAPHKISCPHCTRRFPWTSSLRRHLLTHTGQKPYQCSKCPLLFTTKSNCDRHLARKHSGKPKTNSGSGYNTTEEDEDDEEGRVDEDEVSRGDDVETPVATLVPEVDEPVVMVTTQRTKSAGSSPGEDVSFRCHLCEAAATERDVLLAHMEEDHNETYSLLVSKGALTSSPTSETSEVEPIISELKEKEATHRKVMCVFCVRRFWSVEDLRRHIRSHSGERPFSCTHCSRRFTLKHSMLRHLKKHVTETTTNQTPKTRRSCNKSQNSGSNSLVESDETNLIGRLLGIQDEGLVDQLLNKPDAKDAAKILGLRVGLTRSSTLKTSN